MGTQKSHLNETVLLSTQNTGLNLWVRKLLKFYEDKMTLSGSMYNSVQSLPFRSLHCLLGPVYLIIHSNGFHSLVLLCDPNIK